VLREILKEKISPQFSTLFAQSAPSLKELSTAVGTSAKGGETLAAALGRLEDAVNKELSTLK
jgi:hypothetical protein